MWTLKTPDLQPEMAPVSEVPYPMKVPVAATAQDDADQYFARFCADLAYVRDMLARQEERMNIKDAEDRGKTIGKDLEKEQIAIRMKKLGCDDQLISDATELSLERIKELDVNSAADTDSANAADAADAAGA